MSRTKRPQRTALLAAIAALVLGLAGAAELGAADEYTYTLILEASLGGPLQDGEGDAGFDNGGFQLGFSAVGTGEVHIGGRLGSIDFDGERLGPLTNATLDYVNVGGDYRLHEGMYESGVYIGLGLYELDGTAVTGGDGSESSVGVALGLTGEFELARRFGLMLELTGHVTDLDANEVFVTGHAGLAIHF